MGEHTGTGLPKSVEAAWGLRERPGKGPKRALSLERVVEAGVRVASEEGVQALSMGRVAAELGASTMALYRYVAAKDELLALMIDAILGPPPEPPGPEEGWRAALSRWAWEMRAVMWKHPWALRIPISGPPVTPNNVAWTEAGLRSLRASGLDAGEKLSTLLLVSGFVRQEVMLTVDLTAAFEAASATGEDAMSGYGQLLAKLTDARDFPELHELIRSGIFDEPDEPDYDFTFGLERILDGIAAMVASRRTTPDQPGAHPARRES